MLQRISGWVILAFWLTASGWLVWHDIWPAWTAAAPPAQTTPAWIEQRGARAQTGVFDRFGERRGTIWTTYEVNSRLVSRREVVQLDKFVPLPPLRVEIELSYAEDGALDEFSLKVHGADLPIELKGERFASQMAFKLDAGPLHQTFKLPSSDAAMISGSLNPFPALPDLHVGQSWRMQVFDPLAALLPGRGGRFTQVLAKVVGAEQLSTPAGPAEVFVVEAGAARAWVARDGRVLRQEVELPVLGRIVLRDEPFDEAGCDAARRAFGKRNN